MANVVHGVLQRVLLGDFEKTYCSVVGTDVSERMCKLQGIFLVQWQIAFLETTEKFDNLFIFV